jgi:membrane protein YqaA with SNARE-associated domain
MPRPSFRNTLTWLKVSHRANRDKGVYGYMGWSALKIIVLYAVTITPIVLLLKRFVDLGALFALITETFNDIGVLALFTLSESFLGMIPPDIFVIWSVKFNQPFLMLALLGVLSYTGGVVSFYIGNGLSRHPRIRRFSERALERYIRLVQKWGGAFVVIAALFPFTPYSMIVMAVSLLKFPLKKYLLFGLTRVTRFVIQGIFYLEVMNLGNAFG